MSVRQGNDGFDLVNLAIERVEFTRMQKVKQIVLTCQKKEKTYIEVANK